MMKKNWKLVIISMISLCLWMTLSISTYASTKYEPILYRKITKISVKDSCILKGHKTKIIVRKKADKKTAKYRWKSISYKSLTPSVASVNQKGTVKGIKAGTAKIKVTARYTVKERAYTKCNRRIYCWITRKCKETKIVKVKVLNKLPVHPVITEPVPLVGGSVTLCFQCDGQPYGNPVSVGVGIHPDTDYKDSFPSDPVKDGYLFDGWYSEKGERIGTKAGEIYCAFDKIISGNKATVYARFHLNEESK